MLILTLIPTHITFTIYKIKPLIKANKLFTCKTSKSTNLFWEKLMHCPFLFYWIAWHQSFTHRSVVINPLCEVDKTSLGVHFSVLVHQTVAPIHVFLPYCLLSHLISEIKGDRSQLWVTRSCSNAKYEMKSTVNFYH